MTKPTLKPKPPQPPADAVEDENVWGDLFADMLGTKLPDSPPAATAPDAPAAEAKPPGRPKKPGRQRRAR
jgi:hypothetical protein